jgi:hypothetical protein
LEEALLPKFEQFIRERQYLHDVSPATVSWHTHNLKRLSSESPTEDELKAMVTSSPPFSSSHITDEQTDKLRRVRKIDSDYPPRPSGL